MVFSNCKWIILVSLLLNCVGSIFCDESNFLDNVKRKTQTSDSLQQVVDQNLLEHYSATIVNFKAELQKLNIKSLLLNIKAVGSSNLSESYLEEKCKIALELFINAKSERLLYKIDDSFAINIYLSDSACDVIGSNVGLILPKEFCINEHSASILIRTNTSEIELKSLVLELMSKSKSSNKLGKKLAEDGDDLTLKASTVHTNDDLQEIVEEIVDVITITTGGNIRLRASGGTGDYRWRLINEIESVSRLTEETGADTTYYASNDSRALDVIYLEDGFSVIEYKVVYARIITEKDGTGSTGKDVLCFIQKKNKRD
ncbi:MAG: hypothetical protein COA79_00060 [Planctomycetota bacterium]|nr:MAG: hypothetical protein COA79_00060 [Planctomycetota bacterium]